MARRFDWDNEAGYLDEEELAKSLGEIVYDRRTAGVRRWLELLEDPRVPGPGRRTVVVLCGKTHNLLDDLGICVPERAGGERMAIIALADPDPDEVRGVMGAFRHYLPRTFSRDLLRQAWDAWRLFTYLHELGHARRFIRQGTRGSDYEHEDAANTYAFRQLEKLVEPVVVASALAMMWIGEEGGEP